MKILGWIVLLVSVLSIAHPVHSSENITLSIFTTSLKTIPKGNAGWLAKKEEQILAFTKPAGKDSEGKNVEGTASDTERFQFRITVDKENHLKQLRLLRFKKDIKTGKYQNYKMKLARKWVDLVDLSIPLLKKQSLDESKIIEKKNEKDWLKDKKLAVKIKSKGLGFVENGKYQIMRIYVSKGFDAASGGMILMRVLLNGWEDWHYWFKLELKKNRATNIWFFEMNEKTGRAPCNLLELVTNFDYIFFATRKVGIKEVRFKNKKMVELLKI